jgi:hypothetical protein
VPSPRDSPRQRFDRPEEKAGVERWIAHVFAGFVQTTLFGLPVLWLVLQTPYVYVAAKTAGIAGYLACILAVGTLRDDALPGGTGWRRLSRATLARRDGAHRLLRRATLLAATLATATYGGTLVDLGTGSWRLGVAAALLLAVVGVALVPQLEREGRRALGARVTHYGLALALVFVGATPFDRDAGSALSPELFVVCVAACLVELWLTWRG